MALAISGVTGTISDGQSITITGTDFGATGPTIRLFDDFELGTNGNTFSSVQRDARVGYWNQNTDYNPAYPKYSNAYAHGGSLAMMQDWQDNEGVEGNRIAEAHLSNDTTVYMSFWAYVHSTDVIPGTSMELPNWKVVATQTQSDYTFTLETNSPPVTEGDYCAYLGHWYDAGTPTLEDMSGEGGTFGTSYGSTNFAKGRWHRWEVYLLGHASAGVLGMWETNSANARRQMGYDTGLNTMHSGESWTKIHFPGYARGETAASRTFYDDVYIATGTAALARVEIGNNATYTSCTNLAVCTPTAWGDTEITATVRAGSFTTGTAYLFVVDASGNASAGTEITFGEGSSSKRTLFRK